jgi:hypothetical protein
LIGEAIEAVDSEDHQEPGVNTLEVDKEGAEDLMKTKIEM